MDLNTGEYMLKKINSGLILVFVLALLLRMLGIQYGFPFIFHPDEPTIVRSALGIFFDKNPGHFDWPHLYIYVNYFMYFLFVKFRDSSHTVGLSRIVFSWLPILGDGSLSFYFLSRVLTAFIGALTVIPVYLSSKKLFNIKAGILSALIFAILPMHVVQSHYALPDIPMVFLLAWVVYFSICIFYATTLKDYILGGLLIGFAASAKYNGGLSALGFFLAHVTKSFWQKFTNLKSTGYLFLAGALSILAFLIGTPYALFDYKTFSRTDGPKGALWQFTNVGSREFPDHIQNFFRDMSERLIIDLGYTVLIGFLIYLGIVLYRILKKKSTQRDFGLLFLYITSLVFVYIVSGAIDSRSHYYLIIYPYVAIITGCFLEECLQFFDKKYKYISLLLFVFFLIPPFYASSIASMEFANQDTRNLAFNYLKANLPNTAYLVYFDADFSAVANAVSAKTYKGLDKISKNNCGYIVLYFDSEEYLARKLWLENSVHFIDLQEITRIDPVNRRGPGIVIFKYAL